MDSNQKRAVDEAVLECIREQVQKARAALVETETENETLRAEVHALKERHADVTALAASAKHRIKGAHDAFAE